MRSRRRLYLAMALGPWLLAPACGGPPQAAPKARVQATVVHAVPATRNDVYRWVHGQGTAVAVRRKALYFQLDGKVSYVARSPEGGELRPGDPVSGPKDEELLGELLAKVDDRDVLASMEASKAELQRTQTERLSSEAQLKSAQAELEAARRDLKAARDLQAAGAGNQKDLDDATTRVETAQANVEVSRSRLGSARSGSKAQAAQLRRSEVAQERAAIFAPFDGVIAALNIKEGDYILGSRVSQDTGEQLRTAPIVVIDPSEFELKIELPEYEASRIRVGQPAFVLTGEDTATLSQADDPAARPEALVTRGEVFSVSPSVDPSARSILVTVRVSERSERLRDGEFANCFIMTDQAKDTVSIPYGAFVREDDAAFAFVVDKATQTVERRELQLGLTGVEYIEVRKGITAGEVVVTRGRRSLGDGSRVDVALVEGTPQPAEPPEPSGQAAPTAQTAPAPSKAASSEAAPSEGKASKGVR
ncbi:MAG: efflux RND transporter periplasmic adaptor subunit [Myxococcota bacterium]